MVRAFVAVDLAEEVVGRVSSLVADLKATGADVRWVRREGMHLTLKFLGGVEESAIAGVLEALAASLCGFSPLEVEARGLGVFPSPRKPRVLWVGCEGEGLMALAEAAEESLTALGLGRERRPFRPHLTLGRVRSMRGWAELDKLLARRASDSFGHSSVSQVILFRSTLTSQGSRYSRLGGVELKGTPGGRLRGNDS